MSAVQKIKPIASKHENGRIAVYIGATYSYLPHESALSLFTQLAVALGIPYSEGVARFAGQVLHAHRGYGAGGVGDVDGGQLQDLAIDADLLEPFVSPAGGCSEGQDCECMEGDRCFRLSTIGRGLMELIDAADEPREVRL